MLWRQLASSFLNTVLRIIVFNVDLLIWIESVLTKAILCLTEHQPVGLNTVLKHALINRTLPKWERRIVEINNFGKTVFVMRISFSSFHLTIRHVSPGWAGIFPAACEWASVCDPLWILLTGHQLCHCLAKCVFFFVKSTLNVQQLYGLLPRNITHHVALRTPSKTAPPWSCSSRPPKSDSWDVGVMSNQVLSFLKWSCM